MVLLCTQLGICKPYSDTDCTHRIFENGVLTHGSADIDDAAYIHRHSRTFRIKGNVHILESNQWATRSVTKLEGGKRS